MTKHTAQRIEIKKMIAAHRDEFSKPEYIEALFALTAEDLVGGGVGKIPVHAAMVRAFVNLEAERVGLPAVIDVLRNMADAIEHRVMNSQPPAGHA